MIDKNNNVKEVNKLALGTFRVSCLLKHAYLYYMKGPFILSIQSENTWIIKLRDE
jgi:hypothetical protein